MAKGMSRMHIVVLITAGRRLEAGRISKALVESRLAACVTSVDNVSSLFRWKGKLEAGRETVLIAKSQRSKLPGIVKLVKSLHSYSVPEIIALPVIGGNGDYLDWIDESVR